MFLLLDAARIDTALIEAKQIEEQYIALFEGINEDLLDFGPYLFNFDNPQLNEWYFKNGSGNSWGFIVSSELSLYNLAVHYSKFIKVKTEEGKQLYFRFYDPRVLRIFLLTCNTQQLAEFFDSIQYLLVEDENPTFTLKFYLKNGELQTEKSINQFINV